MAKVVHLTSVHPPFDVRIFYKECKTLAQGGYEVVLIAPHTQDEIVEGVRIRAVPKPRGRLQRMSCTTWRVFCAALQEKADLYHFHDPELILSGLLLKWVAKAKVIYDVHEDNVASLYQKSYLPCWLRRVLGRLMETLERVAGAFLQVAIAEKYYARRFPKATSVLNYPQINSSPTSVARFNNQIRRNRLLYTGTVSQDRGALIHAQIANIVPEVEVYIVGRCPHELAKKMQQQARDGASRLHIEGQGERVPYERIQAYYQQGDWLAGLAIFPATPAYIEKELTKFFEYMWAGIPVLCSDFPVWRSLIEKTGAGMVVDPDDNEAIAKTIRWLLEHPDEAEAMGKRGQEAVRTRYNWDVEAQKLLNLYRSLLA